MDALIQRFAPIALPLVVIGSALVLATAYVFQALGYVPCQMCWWQRYPYMAVIAIGLIALGYHKARGLSADAINALLLVCVTLLFVDGAIAGFHAGVEYRWWEGPSGCAQLVEFSGTVQERLEQLLNTPLVRCDVPAWTLFGISMAGYNFFIANGLAIFGLLSWRKRIAGNI